MPVFQVSSRIAPSSPPSKKKPRRLHQEWIAIISFISAIGGAGGLFILILIHVKIPGDFAFVFLPVLVYFAITQFRSYPFKVPMFMLNVFLNGTPAYLLLTLCLAFIYYSGITGLELLTHQDSTAPHVVFVTTTLAIAIMFDPGRAYAQKRIERRFNLRNRETVRAVQLFISTLREEIDLDQLCDHFLTLMQQTMAPYSVSLWTRISDEPREKSSAIEMMNIADDDPFIAYLLSYPGLLEMSRLQLDTPIVQKLKLLSAEILLPLANQGELIGLLILGPRLKGEEYTAEQRTMLDALIPLGMMQGTRYDEHEATLVPGESLLFYSDGLVEAHNATKEMFGFPRLKTALEAPADGTPLIEVLLGKLKRFTGDGWEQEDDVTMVTLQRAH